MSDRALAYVVECPGTNGDSEIRKSTLWTPYWESIGSAFQPVLDRTDLVFRIGELADSTLIASRLAQQRSVFIASPDYLERFGVPKTLADCARHRLIDKRHAATFMGWRSLLGDSNTAVQGAVLQSDDLQTQLDACVAGIGIAHMPDWVAYSRILTGDVLAISIEPSNRSNTAPIFILWNPGPISAAADVFCAHMRKSIGDPPVWERTVLPSEKNKRKVKKS